MALLPTIQKNRSYFCKENEEFISSSAICKFLAFCILYFCIFVFLYTGISIQRRVDFDKKPHTLLSALTHDLCHEVQLGDTKLVLGQSTPKLLVFVFCIFVFHALVFLYRAELILTRSRTPSSRHSLMIYVRRRYTTTHRHLLPAENK